MDTQRIAERLVELAEGLTAASKSPFEKALEKAIASKIKELKQDGTVSMGMDNMMQVVRPPSPSLEGAPRGTNARYYYKQMFRDVAKRFRFVTASRTAAAGPYTLLEELNDDLRKGRLEDPDVLNRWGFAMGHTRGADWLAGAGLDIAIVLINMEAGRKTPEQAIKVIKSSIRQALKDNIIFKGVSAEEAHDVWERSQERGR